MKYWINLSYSSASSLFWDQSERGLTKMALDPDEYAPIKCTACVTPDRARRLCRWQEPFREFLSHAAPPSTTYQIPHAAERFAFEVGEVCTIIWQLRNNRVPGEDGNPVDVYKACISSLGPWLHRIICKVWSREAVLLNWDGFPSHYARIIEAVAWSMPPRRFLASSSSKKE